ncbi:MAG: DNA-3-methyladenine glycosylase I [Phycisphaeraceae bacterium]|nr:DNA-3-methyladenine glycosylase I [Phycisphaeraceae bacterium]
MSTTQTDLVIDAATGTARCRWCMADPIYVAYHDQEWGAPQTDDARLFEKICLEGFQAGLSWLTILRKRSRFREVFHDFDPPRVARMTARDVERLLGDAGIVRHRGKIESTIRNAARCLELLDEQGSLAAYLRRVTGNDDDRPAPRRLAEVPAKTPASVALSRDLRRRGWSFVGPTTMYAFMQSVGLVNDHLVGCHRRAACGARPR